jgi:hypothetical protein
MVASTAPEVVETMGSPGLMWLQGVSCCALLCMHAFVHSSAVLHIFTSMCSALSYQLLVP